MVSRQSRETTMARKNIGSKILYQKKITTFETPKMDYLLMNER